MLPATRTRAWLFELPKTAATPPVPFISSPAERRDAQKDGDGKPVFLQLLEEKTGFQANAIGEQGVHDSLSPGRPGSTPTLLFHGNGLPNTVLASVHVRADATALASIYPN